MSSLNVTAEATAAGIVTPKIGWTGVVFAVLVTLSDGTPVKGLTKNNFKIHYLPTRFWPSPDCPLFLNNVTITCFSEGPPSGFYTLFSPAAEGEEPLDLLPQANQKTIYAVEVKAARKAGKTMTSLYHVENPVS